MRALAVTVVLGGLTAGCVPDFAYGGGETSGPSGGGGSGGGAGGAPSTSTTEATSARAASGVGNTSSVGPGPGPGPSSVSSSGSSETTTGASSTTGGDGGQDATSTSSSVSTGTGLTDGVPCWNGPAGEAVTCSSTDLCCYDFEDATEDTCGASCDPGTAIEIECNDVNDCGDLRCCVTKNLFDDITAITCEDFCVGYEACSLDVPCDSGTCYYAFDPDVNPDVYDAYGYCD